MTKEKKSKPTTKDKTKSKDDEVKKVAKSLGVNLDNDGGGKKEKESDSKKTDTKTADKEGRSGDLEKDVDYKEKYAASTKEFQEKYKPMEDMVNKLKDATGKSLEDFVKAFEKPKELDKEKKDAPKDESEVAQKFSSIEKEISSLKEKFEGQEREAQVLAKKKVDAFRGKYEMSEGDYKAKIQPLLSGIKEMKKPNGDPYTLEEALETAYVVANKDNIDKMVDQKAKIKQKEVDLTFSPQGAKQTSDIKKKEFTDQQEEIAGKMGTKLGKEEK